MDAYRNPTDYDLNILTRAEAEEQAIAFVLENAGKDPTDRTRAPQSVMKLNLGLTRRANILYKRTETRHLSDKAAEREATETAPLRALLADTEDRAEKRRIQRAIDGYRILNVQRPIPGLGNDLKTLPIANRALRRKMAHDARRGMKHTDLVGNFGRLALHVLEADTFNKALAERYELGLSKDVRFAGTAGTIAEEVTEREAA